MMIKMYCIFSQESLAKMQGNRGKACAQAGHAYLHAWWDSEELLEHFIEQQEATDPREQEANHNEYLRLLCTISEYKNGNDARKICLIVNTDEELKQLYEDYRGFTGTTLVEDAGYTVVDPGTITCVGIGPLRDSEKGDDLRALDLFI